MSDEPEVLLKLTPPIGTGHAAYRSANGYVLPAAAVVVPSAAKPRPAVERKRRCAHVPESLFDQPRADDREGRIYAMLDGHVGRGWVRCSTCGETGYGGGYGMKRRVRWGYGGIGEGIVVAAAKWNRWLAERNARLGGRQA